MYFVLMTYPRSLFYFFFFFNDTATTEIYTLSLHDALPICFRLLFLAIIQTFFLISWFSEKKRSEERFSRNAETDLVCRLLLEKKKNWRAMEPPGLLHCSVAGAVMEDTERLALRSTGRRYRR